MSMLSPDVPYRRRNSSGNSGFSLIEAVVALAIVAFALAVIADNFSTGLLGHETAGAVDAALALADEKLAGAEAAASLRPGQNAGVFANRFQWQLTIAPYEDPAGTSMDKPVANLRLFRIQVSIAWREGHRQRQLALSTLRLVPAPP
jgi:prepilin-type N-terminal cleavage/methylation domain-containing protein